MQREQLLVSDAATLERTAEAISAEPRVALDTESNGFHAYTEQVCLVQLATPQADYAIDVLAVGLGPLLPLLADARREVVLHAAEYDVTSLKREWGLTLGRIFDTHAAAKVLGIGRVGLSDLLQGELNVTLTEDQQRSDWGRRPLSAEQIAYAFADVQHLLPLRDLLGARLSERGLLPEAEAEFARLIAKEARARQFDVEGWQKMKAARTLDGKGRGVLREMYVLRDRRARELNRPPFKVLSDLLLAEVARRQPRTEEEVMRIPGAQSAVLRKLAPQILEAVRAGQSGAPPPPRAAQLPPWRRGTAEREVEDRYEKLRAWRKARAEARKVEVQVIAPNAVLMAVARSAPGTLEELSRVEGMDEFRLRQYGAEMLAALNGTQTK
ncbi:MAG TPA: HRDC domain-containing protein [Myxococcales bacterium]|nr:HRDC domain-containing protein [Myxococcales bacterium]